MPSFWRRRRGEPIPEAGDAGYGERTEPPERPEDSPDRAAIRLESVSLVRAAIDKLPSDLKTVILLFEYESLSYSERHFRSGLTSFNCWTWSIFNKAINPPPLVRRKIPLEASTLVSHRTCLPGDRCVFGFL